MIEEKNLKQNFDEFKEDELTEIKNLYDEYDNMDKLGIRDPFIENLPNYNFLNTDHLERFRKTFERFYNSNKDEQLCPIDKIDTVNFVLQRNKYCSLMTLFKGLMASYYADSHSEEKVKEQFKKFFDGEFFRVPIFKSEEWDKYDIFDIKNKLFIAARQELDDYIDLYPSLLGKYNRQVTYEMLTRSIECAMY